MAFKKVNDLGSQWFLPTVKEMESIYKNRDKLNIYLTKSGKSPIAHPFYWSSTERDLLNAYCISLVDTILDNNSVYYALEDNMIFDTLTNVDGMDSLCSSGYNVKVGMSIFCSKSIELPLRAMRKLSWTEINSKPKKKYNIGDLYYAADGSTVLGVVCEINNDGYNGKIISLHSDSSVWSLRTDTMIGAINMDNGSNNTSILQSANDHVNYPICSKIQSQGWYLPSLMELKSISKNMDQINSSLESNNGTALERGKLYWSSTEIDLANSYAVLMNGLNAQMSTGKSTMCKVVLMYEF